mmetsp:Transcript_53804/g.130858  ORF Transcript_53804/g.130858 Transcript_53804/m.130858 type:complete len:681 (+) Transcript_53804:212-2254(+)
MSNRTGTGTSTSNKKAKTRHVIKFRDWEIDEDDFNVLNSLLHTRARSEKVHDPRFAPENPRSLIHDGHVKLGDTPKGDRRVTAIRINPLTRNGQSLYFDGIFSSIQRFDSLESLSLDRTNITDLPENLDRLRSLQELSLKRCRSLTETPTVLENMDSLKVLDLRDCGLHKLSDGIGKMDRLEILRLSMTYLDALPTSIGYLTNLKELELEGTNETEDDPLTPYLSKLHNLEILHVTSCTFSRFPSDFVANCSKIKTLHLEWTHDDGSDSDKACDTIQKIRKMQSLEKAQVDSDKYVRNYLDLDELSDKCVLSVSGQLKNLKELSLSGVVVYLMDLDGQHSLENLSLENCVVKMSGTDSDADTRVCTMDSLRVLRIEACYCQFDLSSLQCSKLENLDYSFFNKSPVLSHCLKHYPNLRKINMKHLDSVSFIGLESLSKLAKLEDLELHNVLPLRERKVEGSIAFPYLRRIDVEVDPSELLSTDRSIEKFFRMIEVPLLQSFSCDGCTVNFEKICSELVSKCPHLELVGFRNKKIFAISESTISSLPPTLKVLDLEGNFIVREEETYEASIDQLLKMLTRCPQLGYIGFDQRLTDPSGKIGYTMSMNRARSRILASQKIPTALWSHILANAPAAFKHYSGLNGNDSLEWKERDGFRGIKEPAGAIFCLLRQRAARDLFYPED